MAEALKLTSQCSRVGQLGIPMIGLGFGEQWIENFVIQLADRSVKAEPGSHPGAVEYIPSAEQVQNWIQEVYRSIQGLAQNVNVNLRGATQKLRQAVTILLAQGATELAGQMQPGADRLEQSGERSSDGRQTIRLTRRKTVRIG